MPPDSPPIDATAPVTIYLARHGETPYNVEGRLQGQCVNAPGLTPAGLRQAAALAAALATEVPRPTAVFTSDLARAVETAAAMVEGLGCGPATLVPALRERELGTHLTGCLRSSAKRDHPAAFRALASGASIPGGGESEAELRRRVGGALVAVAAAARAAEASTVVAISHGGACAAAHAEAMGGARPRGRTPNCAYGVLRVGGGGKEAREGGERETSAQTTITLVDWGHAGAAGAADEGGGMEGG